MSFHALQRSNISRPYAGEGIALACLSNKMLHPFISSYGYLPVRSGSVSCSGQPGIQGVVLVAVLIVLHLALLLLPLYMITVLYKSARNNVKSFEILLVAMGVFSLASLGEISQHIHDNWLYLGLIPSFYNAVFYGGLTFGQALLARGIRGPAHSLVYDIFPGILCVAALVVTTVLSAAQPANPVLVWIVVFGSLTWTSVSFVLSAAKAFKKDVPTLPYGVGIAAGYIFGVVFSVLVESTGYQALHIPTASGFIIGFVVQARWLYLGVSAAGKPHAN